jgi:hypothetical protein
MPKKLSYEFVKQEFEYKGWKMVDTSYVNSKQKLKVICPNGHNIEKSYNDIMYSGCKYEKLAQSKKIDIETVRKEFEKEGWTLLEEEYKNNHQKLLVICPEGHITSKKYNNFQQGSRCFDCHNPKRGLPTKFKYQDVKDDLESKDWELLSKEYIDNSTHLSVICPKGHKIQKTYMTFRKYHGCYKCVNFKNEDKCRKIIEGYTGLKFEKRKLKILQGLELDGYNEETNTAFEFNGDQHYKFVPTFFHKKNGIHDFVKQICRDKIKKRLCKENGIKLIIINNKTMKDFDENPGIYYKEACNILL